MDTLSTVSQVFGYLLPILGCIALAFLIAILVKLFKSINKINTTVDNVNKTVGTVNGYLTDLSVTVKTVNNVAMSVEAVRVTLSKVMKKAVKKWIDEYENIKKLLTAILDKITKPSGAVTIVDEKTEEK